MARRIKHYGAEAARSRLPELLRVAEGGEPSVISRRGRPVAALVPIDRLDSPAQQPLTPLVGSGSGLWGNSSRRTFRRLRNEWSR